MAKKKVKKRKKAKAPKKQSAPPAPKKETVDRKRRVLLKAGIIGGGILAGLGGYYGVSRLRFNRWKRNADLVFLYGSHRGKEGAGIYLRAIREAKSEGKPFDFIVRENNDLLESERRKHERKVNKLYDDARQAYEEAVRKNPKNIKQLDEEFGKRIRKIFPKVGAGGFSPRMHEIAIREGLLLKYAEGHSSLKRVKELDRVQKEAIGILNKLQKKFFEMPTQEIYRTIMKAMEKYTAFHEGRNKEIARVVSRAAAEIREEHPEFRGKRLRGLVQLGTLHAMADDKVKSMKIKDLEVTQMASFDLESPVARDLAIFMQMKGKKLNTPDSLRKLVIAQAIERTYGTHIKNPAYKEWGFIMLGTILDLPEKKALEIFENLKRKVGQEREIAVMEGLGFVVLREK